jgi:hypothetical protein
MLKVFHVDVSKIDQNVAYITMAIHMLQASVPNISAVQTDVARVLSGYCICFTLMLHMFHPDVAYVFAHMLQVFHLNVAYVLQWLHTCFPHVLDICCKCFNYFGRMLQMFPLNVVKVDMVEHMLQCPDTTAGPTYMRVGVNGARAVGMRNRARTNRDGAGMGHEAARGTERHGTLREVGMRRGRPDASPCPDVER